MAELIIQPCSLDTYIQEHTPTTTRGTETELYLNGYSATYRTRILLKYDLSTIPSNAIISAAVIGLYCSTDGQSGAITVNAYRVFRAWTNSATWNGYGGGSWGTAGCDNTTSDRSSVSIGSASFDGTGWKSLTLGLTEFKYLRDSNNGLILIGTVAGADGDDAYYSSENGSASKPKLTVTYVPGGGSGGVFLSDYGVI
jgi:hypothetical protein